MDVEFQVKTYRNLKNGYEAICEVLGEKIEPIAFRVHEIRTELDPYWKTRSFIACWDIIDDTICATVGCREEFYSETAVTFPVSYLWDDGWEATELENFKNKILEECRKSREEAEKRERAEFERLSKKFGTV